MTSPGTSSTTSRGAEGLRGGSRSVDGGLVVRDGAGEQRRSCLIQHVGEVLGLADVEADPHGGFVGRTHCDSFRGFPLIPDPPKESRTGGCSQEISSSTHSLLAAGYIAFERPPQPLLPATLAGRLGLVADAVTRRGGRPAADPGQPRTRSPAATSSLTPLRARRRNGERAGLHSSARDGSFRWGHVRSSTASAAHCSPAPGRPGRDLVTRRSRSTSTRRMTGVRGYHPLLAVARHVTYAARPARPRTLPAERATRRRASEPRATASRRRLADNHVDLRFSITLRQQPQRAPAEPRRYRPEDWTPIPPRGRCRSASRGMAASAHSSLFHYSYHDRRAAMDSGAILPHPARGLARGAIAKLALGSALVTRTRGGATCSPRIRLTHSARRWIHCTSPGAGGPGSWQPRSCVYRSRRRRTHCDSSSGAAPASPLAHPPNSAGHPPPSSPG